MLPCLHAQPYQLNLLKDINPTGSSNARGMIAMNGIYYFNAYSSNEGFELWRTDGTASGTFIVKDINPGSADASTSFYPVKMNNRIYFPATTVANGMELWSSDGTAAGTQLVADVNPGPTGSFIFQMTVYNNKVYFVTDHPTYGSELWSSDGTAAGTQIVKDINPGTGSSNISLSTLNIVNDKLVFTANDGTNGSRLWCSDGTAAGTKMISPSMNIFNIIGAGSTTMNNNIYFPGTSGNTQLWRSDGTEAGTVKVADIVSVTGGSGINNLVTVGNNIFFKVGTKELWKSDGTAAGTVLVKNMEPVSNGGTFAPVYMLAYDNNTLLFTCNYSNSWDTNPWGCELWKSDGTDAGTSLVKSFNNLYGSTGVTPNSFTRYNGRYYFMAYSSSGYYELWKTDATAAGTSTVRNFPQLDGSFPEAITVANGLMYYVGWGATNSSNYGLWQSDGSSGGTVKIAETGSGCTQKPANLLLYPDKEIVFATAIENFTGNYYGEEPFITSLPAKPVCTQNNTPGISISSNAAGPVCPGTSISFTATTVFGGPNPAFQWKKNGTNISWATGSTFAIHSLNNNDTISCVLSSNADCITANTANSNKIIVPVLTAPVPVISTSGPTTFCQGGSVTLTSSAANSYLWSNGATTRSITVNTAGSYSVTVINASGCKGTSSSKVIAINPLPVPTITADGLTTFCQGGSVTLTASAASSYLWSNGATTQSTTVSSSGNYHVTVTNASGCSASATPVAITVNPLPSPTVTANGPTTFCEGNSVELVSTAATGYTWYNDLNQPIWYQQNITITTAGSYHVTAVDANGCPGSSDVVVVSTNPQPTPTVTASGPTAFCQGGSVTLTSSAANTYLWSNGASTRSITVNTAGNYSVTVTNANGCSGISGTTAVFVYALPSATITASGPTTFCQGGNVRLTSSTANSYLWSNGATTKAILVNTTGDYTVTVTDFSTGCSATSVAKPVVVTPLPVVTITASGPLTFCEGGSVTLTSSTASSYLWSTGATTKSIIVSAAGNYNVQAKNDNGCAGVSAVTKVVVNPIPKPTATASGPTTFCQGGNVKLTCSVNGTYLWSNGATTKTIAVTTAGNYSVTVTSNGCQGISASTPVVVNPLPTTSITASGATTNLCPGATVTLSADAGFKSYLWSNSATTRSIVVNAPGNYSVAVTNAGNCSGNSAVTKVAYITCPAPKALKATLTSATAVSLTWSAATCNAGYQLQYKASGAPTFTTVNLTSPSYSINNLTQGTTYQWQVATICQGSPLILSAYTTGGNFSTVASLYSISKPRPGAGSQNGEELFGVSVTPNPAFNNAILHVNGTVQNASASIIDLSGRVLWKRNHITEKQVSLPVEQLARGVYFVSVTNNNETRMLKLVKE